MNKKIKRADFSFPFGGRWNEKKWRPVFWLISPILLLIFWAMLSHHLNKPYLLPTPEATFYLLLHPGKNLLGQGSLWTNTAVSLLRIAVGFTVAMIIAVPLGTILGSVTPLKRFSEPVIELFRPICPIAWIPFAIAVFKIKTIPETLGLGYTETIFDHLQLGMIFVIFWGGFFPILINTVDGVSRVNKNYFKLAGMLGASKPQLLTKVAFPAASPMILTGLRQGIGLCWFVIIAAEMLPGSDSGIGYLLVYAADQSAMNIVVASIIIIGIIGASFNFLMVFASRKFLSWKGKEI